MIHLLIDGYNLLYAIDPGRLRPLEEKRATLLEKLHDYQVSKHVEITVVFDGSLEAALFRSRDKWGAIQIIFTHEDETADSWIDTECQRYPGKYLVVSNDNEVKRSAEMNRSISISCDEFIHKLEEAVRFREDPGYFSEKDDSGPLYPRVSTKKKGVSKRPAKRDRKKLQRLRNL
jgi:hypothetical protein